jgi:hypothetical protein
MKPNQNKSQVKLSLSKTTVSRLSEANMMLLNTGAANMGITSPKTDGDPMLSILHCNSVMACSGWDTCIYCEKETN